jgi:hypothetical protein
MSTLREIDLLVDASMNEGLPIHEVLSLQQKLAGQRYRLAEEVSGLSKQAMQTEVDRKACFAKAKMRAKAQSNAGKPLSETAASDEAEQHPEVIRARAEEIMAQAEYEAAKLKYNASGDVVSALTMRISFLRDEAKNTRMVSSHDIQVQR